MPIFACSKCSYDATSGEFAQINPTADAPIKTNPARDSLRRNSRSAANGCLRRLKDSDRSTYTGEGIQRAIHLLLRQGRANLHANARRAFGPDRITESGDEHAVFEQLVAHRNRERGFAHDDRNDRALPLQRMVTDAFQAGSKIGRVFAKFPYQLRMSVEIVDRFERAACDGGGQRV